MAKDDLISMDVRSGVTNDGAGFCTIVAHAGDGRLVLGQMAPDETRAQAQAWLEAAEAADQDAAVLRCIRKLGLPEQLAGAIIAELRDSRGQGGATPTG